jgi:hypothetical protein
MSKPLRDVLAQIYAKHGFLSKEVVLAESTPRNADLHDRFEWDDKAGAHANRLHQAGRMIRSVKVVYKEPTGKNEPGTVRAWTSYTAPESKPVYMPTETAMADPFIKEFTLRNMRREFLALKRKYGHMEEFASMLAGGQDEQEAV